jgi:uncharacterized membrane protein YoaK (UPF0700 family)
MMVGNMLLFGQAFTDWTMCGGDEQEFFVPAPLFFVIMLVLFVCGAAAFRCAERRGFTGKSLAPLTMLLLGVYDLAQIGVYYEGKLYNRLNIVFLCPIFGALNASAMRRGLGTLPWGTSGHVISVAFMLSDICSGHRVEVDWQGSLKALLMITAMICGAISGSWFMMYEGGDAVLEYSIAGCGFALLAFANDDIFAKSAAPAPEKSIPAPAPDRNTPEDIESEGDVEKGDADTAVPDEASPEGSLHGSSSESRQASRSGMYGSSSGYSLYGSSSGYSPDRLRGGLYGSSSGNSLNEASPEGGLQGSSSGAV